MTCPDRIVTIVADEDAAVEVEQTETDESITTTYRVTVADDGKGE